LLIRGSLYTLLSFVCLEAAPLLSLPISLRSKAQSRKASARVVYVAEDLKVGRHVALKFLPNKLANNGQAPSRLQRGGAKATSS
jgi:hypothetical protein